MLSSLLTCARRRPFTLRGCFAFALFVAAPAFADVLTPTLGQPLREVSHTVDVTIDKGIAVYKVRRVFANAGERADEAGLEIDLPYGAAATALRIRARHRWYDGELYEAEEAARRYHEMTGMGAHAVKDPALLQWMWADKLYLQVFPVLPKSTSTVEYTLTVPTRYERGKVFLSYPHVATTASAPAEEPVDADGAASAADTGPPLATPVLTLRPAWGDATTYVVIDGARVATETPIVLAPPVVPAWAAELGLNGASAVASDIVVPDLPATQRPVSALTVTLDIEHTFKSDLRVNLITPSGELLPVFDGAGGDENDVKGVFPIALDKPASAVGRWRLVVSDHAARDAGTVNAWALKLGAKDPKDAYVARATDTPVFVPDAPESANDGGTATIVLEPPPIDVVAARLGKVVASKEHAFSRLELDAAPELRPLPKNARVVFVIDASHSAGEAHIAAQLALVRGYLSHVPDAHAEIVVTRRHATRAFGRFVPAKDVPAAITKAHEALAFDAGNGSALDEGVRAAIQAMEGAPGSAHRVVLMTDELLRSRFQNAWVLDDLRALRAAAIVHVVAPSMDYGQESHLRRDDNAALAPFASEHHGIFARIDGLPANDKRVADAVLGLVRPTQIDFFAVKGLDISRDDDAIAGDGSHGGNVLHEGAGLRAMVPLTSSASPDRVVLSGKIWGDAFRRTVNVDKAFSRATAAWVFGEDEHHALSEKEQLTVAFMGRAVSPVTSYLATEPGVRPSPIGIDRTSSGYGSGLGAYGGRSGASVSLIHMGRDLRGLVDAAARACFAQHDAKQTRKVVLDVETTEDEVVDVIAPDGAERDPLTSCLVEAVWAVRLTSAFDKERDQFKLTFP